MSLSVTNCNRVTNSITASLQAHYEDLFNRFHSGFAMSIDLPDAQLRELFMNSASVHDITAEFIKLDNGNILVVTVYADLAAFEKETNEPVFIKLSEQTKAFVCERATLTVAVTTLPNVGRIMEEVYRLKRKQL